MHDQRTSADPPEATVAVASPPPADRAREVDYLLDRLLAGERTLMRVIEALTPSPSFAEVFAFYRESGFLYPAKLASLQPRLAAIEETWRALLNGDPAIFRLIARRGYANGQFELNSTTSAFAYAPGTWQAQHLVNGERGEYIGTLSVLMDMMEWLHHSGAEYMRFYFRPSNPGTNRLPTSAVDGHARGLVGA